MFLEAVIQVLKTSLTKTALPHCIAIAILQNRKKSVHQTHINRIQPVCAALAVTIAVTLQAKAKYLTLFFSSIVQLQKFLFTPENFLQPADNYQKLHSLKLLLLLFKIEKKIYISDDMNCIQPVCTALAVTVLLRRRRRQKQNISLRSYEAAQLS